jgi:hypothetical protein
VNGLKLPALKGLGSLADCEPIIVDTREQTPLPFRRFQTRGGALLSGDYSVAGLEQLFAVERKSIGDVVACCVGQNRERFGRELHRLRGFRFKGLLVVGNEAEILAGVAAARVESWAFWLRGRWSWRLTICAAQACWNWKHENAHKCSLW